MNSQQARLPQRQIVVDEQRQRHGPDPPSLQRAQADVGADQHLRSRRLGLMRHACARALHVSA